MHALRRLARPAVATAAAVLLLSGCGGDDDSGSTASTTTPASPTTSSPATSGTPSGTAGGSAADDEVAAFCAQAEEFVASLGAVDPTVPESIPPALTEASAAFDAAEPPAEITADWAVLGDSLRSFADTANTVDLATPEGGQALADAATEFQNVFTGPSGTAVDEYISGNCT
ncbi:hypothetical protein [Trujillonella humicola]|uniref:hypothetical protein n=1 Tax=Trujillonella humicola TaxID=3383699 RepID=UPI00390579E0